MLALILTTTLKGKDYHPNFTDRENEAQRCPRLSSKQKREPGFEARSLNSKL